MFRRSSFVRVPKLKIVRRVQPIMWFADCWGGFEGVGHVLTCDNSFTSPALLYDLAGIGVFPNGICRTDRWDGLLL